MIIERKPENHLILIHKYLNDVTNAFKELLKIAKKSEIYRIPISRTYQKCHRKERKLLTK